MKHFNLLLATTVLATFGGIVTADSSYLNYCVDGYTAPRAYLVICGQSKNGKPHNVQTGLGSSDVEFHTFDRDQTRKYSPHSLFLPVYNLIRLKLTTLYLFPSVRVCHRLQEGD